jgi:hypothetical protein
MSKIMIRLIATYHHQNPFNLSNVNVSETEFTYSICGNAVQKRQLRTRVSDSIKLYFYNTEQVVVTVTLHLGLEVPSSNLSWAKDHDCLLANPYLFTINDHPPTAFDTTYSIRQSCKKNLIIN